MQLNPLLGIAPCSNTIESLEMVFKSFSNLNLQAVSIGLLTLLIVFLFPKKWNKYVPSQILALIICTIVSIKMGLNVSKISEISVSLPAIHIPQTNLHDLITYLQYSITLAVILSSESLLTGLVCTSITKVQLPPKKLVISTRYRKYLLCFDWYFAGFCCDNANCCSFKDWCIYKISCSCNFFYFSFINL